MKLRVLKFSTGTRWFVRQCTWRKHAPNILKWEKILLVRLCDNLIKLTRTLGTKLIARFYELCWSTLTSHEGGGAVEHRVWTTGTVVECTGLRIHENFFGGTHRGMRRILNNFHSWLKLIRHLLLTKKLFHRTNHFFYLRWDRAPRKLLTAHHGRWGHTYEDRFYTWVHSSHRTAIQQKQSDLLVFR